MQQDHVIVYSSEGAELWQLRKTVDSQQIKHRNLIWISDASMSLTTMLATLAVKYAGHCEVTYG